MYDNEVSVFYPIDRDYYNSHIKQRNTLQQRHGDKTVLGLAKASVDYGKDNHMPVFFLRFMKFIMMDTVENAEISKDFISDNLNQ